MSVGAGRDDNIRAQEMIPARGVVHVIHVEAERSLVRLGEDSSNHDVAPVLEEEIGRRTAVQPPLVVADEVHDLVLGERKRIEVFRNSLEHFPEGGTPEEHETMHLCFRGGLRSSP